MSSNILNIRCTRNSTRVKKMCHVLPKVSIDPKRSTSFSHPKRTSGSDNSSPPDIIKNDRYRELNNALRHPNLSPLDNGLDKARDLCFKEKYSMSKSTDEIIVDNECVTGCVVEQHESTTKSNGNHEFSENTFPDIHEESREVVTSTPAVEDAQSVVASSEDSEPTCTAVTDTTANKDSSMLSAVESNKIVLSLQESNKLDQSYTEKKANTTKQTAMVPGMVVPQYYYDDHNYCEVVEYQKAIMDSLKETECENNFHCDESIPMTQCGYVSEVPGTVGWCLNDCCYANTLPHLLPTSFNYPFSWDGDLAIKDFVISKIPGLFLTVDLERLVETNCLGESLYFNNNKPSTNKKRDSRVKQRRKDFFITMSSSDSSDTEIVKHYSSSRNKGGSYYNNNSLSSLAKRWLKLDQMGSNEVFQLIEDTTDVLYCGKYVKTPYTMPGHTLPAHTLPAYTLPAYTLPQASQFPISPTYPSPDHKELGASTTNPLKKWNMPQFHINKRLLLARSMARYRPEHKAAGERDTRNTDHATPTSTAKEKLGPPNDGKTNSSRFISKSESAKVSEEEGKVNAVKKEMQKNESNSHNLRSRRVKIPAASRNRKKESKSTASAKAHSDSVETESADNEKIHKSWITQSEDWLREPLDIEGMLKLQ